MFDCSFVQCLSMFSISIILAFITSCNFVTYSHGARILAIAHTPSYSHQVVYRPLWKELARRGHELVLLTCDPMEYNENITQIDLSIAYKVVERHDYSKKMSTMSKKQMMDLSIFNHMLKIIYEIHMEEFLLPDVQKLINNETEKFDLLIHETGFSAHIGFAERFNVPNIALFSMEVPFFIHEIMGNNVHPLLHQDMGGVLGFQHPLSLRERIISVVFNWSLNFYHKFFVGPVIDDVIKKVFRKNTKTTKELMKEIDMLFINVNPVLHPMRALTPNTIMFGGGSHVDKVPKPLPEDIQKFLDNATDGAIYFSLGSNVKSALISEDLRQILIEALKELPYKVLWKFENKELPNKPDNVMIQKWLPQSDVLRHPNVKAFVTQCGLQSMEEAIMNNIPLVGLPFFGDQPANAILMQNKGFGISLDHTKLTKEMFNEAILEVVNNPKYKEEMMKVANLTMDVQMTGLDKMVWWTEYVIRNKGANLFRNPIRDLPLYQYYLLDVIVFVGLICVIVTFIIFKMNSFIFKYLNHVIRKKIKRD